MGTGITGEGRREIARVLRAGRAFVSVRDVAVELGASQVEAARKLARWCRQGWLRRVRRGLYVPVPVEAENPSAWSQDRLILRGAQSALEREFGRMAWLAKILQIKPGSVGLEERANLVNAPARKGHVLRQFLGAGDHPGDPCRRQTHALALEEDGVLERGDALQAHAGERRECPCFDEDLLTEGASDLSG
ncbi:MAG: type IV toxin-antitoxin system AbiEi family antitoxin domain-containing protein [Deltaproteobacteria bacterium]|nr:type IV toxin-antitoxin system AbiEi family antitoxin domain-containing protein [Deltaproteobacteria bacterium]